MKGGAPRRAGTAWEKKAEGKSGNGANPRRAAIGLEIDLQIKIC